MQILQLTLEVLQGGVNIQIKMTCDDFINCLCFLTP